MPIKVKNKRNPINAGAGFEFQYYIMLYMFFITEKFIFIGEELSEDFEIHKSEDSIYLYQAKSVKASHKSVINGEITKIMNDNNLKDFFKNNLNDIKEWVFIFNESDNDSMDELRKYLSKNLNNNFPNDQKLIQQILKKVKRKILIGYEDINFMNKKISENSKVKMPKIPIIRRDLVSKVRSYFTEMRHFRKRNSSIYNFEYDNFNQLRKEIKTLKSQEEIIEWAKRRKIKIHNPEEKKIYKEISSKFDSPLKGLFYYKNRNHQSILKELNNEKNSNK